MLTHRQTTKMVVLALIYQGLIGRNCLLIEIEKQAFFIRLLSSFGIKYSIVEEQVI